MLGASGAAGKFQYLLFVKGEQQTTCFFSYDFLVMYDGGLSTSPMMGKYCGYSIPPSHISSSNEVLIQFQSDGSATRAGFKMEYHPIGNTSISNNTQYYGGRYIILRIVFISSYLYSLLKSHQNCLNERIFSMTFKCGYLLLKAVYYHQLINLDIKLYFFHSLIPKWCNLNVIIDHSHSAFRLAFIFSIKNILYILSMFKGRFYSEGVGKIFQLQSYVPNIVIEFLFPVYFSIVCTY